MQFTELVVQKTSPALHQVLGIYLPLITTNRINTPEVAEDLLASGTADLVSMARPLLADPAFANKTREGRADEINTCIGCNQACLDHIFTERVATCLHIAHRGFEGIDDLIDHGHPPKAAHGAAAAAARALAAPGRNPYFSIFDIQT